MDVSAEKLVTEELKKKFGDVLLEVTEQDNARRIGCIRRARDKAILTYHVVTFRKRGVSALGDFHGTIVKGKPMGEIIKYSGVPHVRRVFPPEMAAMPDYLRALFATKKKQCRMQIIDYWISGKKYAHIKEYYNPEFMPVRSFTSQAPRRKSSRRK